MFLLFEGVSVDRSEDRILTTHVGSLIRPPVLRDIEAARMEHQRIDEPAYYKLLKDQVHAAVAQQVDAGLDIINDGEYGKSSWSAYIMERITGFEIRPEQLHPLSWLGRDIERFPGFYHEEFPRAFSGLPTEACVAPISYVDKDSIQRDIDNLKSAIGARDSGLSFLTTVAPASTAYSGVNEYYPSEEEYVFALAEALRQEYLAVYQSGLLVQVDDAVLANMYDALVGEGRDHYRNWAELRIAALNHALRDIPEDRIRYHVCFGSWHVPHVSDAPLEEIVDLILSVKAQAYSIEAANPRHEHEWRVWEKVKLPDGKILIPGVVTHHTTTVEHPRVVADRIIRFANIVGRENVIAGTDCGFAQSYRLQRVHPEVMWAKFRTLVEGARIASDELW